MVFLWFTYGNARKVKLLIFFSLFIDKCGNVLCVDYLDTVK